MALTCRVESESPSEVSTLLFLRRQEKLYLFQIWTGGEKDGNQIPLLNEEERRDRYGAASSIVRLRAQTRSYPHLRCLVWPTSHPTRAALAFQNRRTTVAWNCRCDLRFDSCFHRLDCSCCATLRLNKSYVPCNVSGPGHSLSNRRGQSTTVFAF